MNRKKVQISKHIYTNIITVELLIRMEKFFVLDSSFIEKGFRLFMIILQPIEKKK